MCRCAHADTHRAAHTCSFPRSLIAPASTGCCHAFFSLATAPTASRACSSLHQVMTNARASQHRDFMWVGICACVHACKPLDQPKRTNMRKHTRARTYIHTYTCAHARTHTHTHDQRAWGCRTHACCRRAAHQPPRTRQCGWQPSHSGPAASDAGPCRCAHACAWSDLVRHGQKGQ